MSAPETKARVPAPVSATTRTPSSAAKSSRISASPLHISTDIALCFSGWLNVMSPMPACLSASILPPAYSMFPATVLRGARGRWLPLPERRPGYGRGVGPACRVRCHTVDVQPHVDTLAERGLRDVDTVEVPKRIRQTVVVGQTLRAGAKEHC